MERGKEWRSKKEKKGGDRKGRKEGRERRKAGLNQEGINKMEGHKQQRKEARTKIKEKKERGRKESRVNAVRKE